MPIFKRLLIVNILLTGGTGYIGSHTVLALHAAGFKPVILDDFSNSSPAVLGRLQKMIGESIVFERCDVADAEKVSSLIHRHEIGGVIHFAGFKSVGESVNLPLKYFANNIGGMTALLQGMKHTNCRVLVFSSSATVYGEPASVPISEGFPTSHSNPYGLTKLACEHMLTALGTSDRSWRIGVLRYFNPAGAHPSGLIGEDPAGVPNNLMPYLSQVAVGRLPHLNIFGNDYATPDGTGVRDYIHVQDLAQGHVAALRQLLAAENGFTVNLGTGRGHSVLEVIQAFEQATGQKIAYKFLPRRPGDVAECYADASLAHHLLHWRAGLSLAEMCSDAWRWQKSNPEGYI